MQMNSRSSHPRIYGPGTRAQGPKAAGPGPGPGPAAFGAWVRVPGPYMRGCDEREFICICIYVYMYVYVYVYIYIFII